MERWLLAGADDAVGRRLAARFGMAPPPAAGRRFVCAGTGYAAALGGPGPGWDAVVYRPLRRAGAAGAPDLGDAEAFFSALALACRAAARPPRLVLISSAAAVSPRHHHAGYVAESERPPGSHPLARAWLALEALAAERCAMLGVAQRIVLRPAVVAARDGEDEVCRLLRGRAAVVPAGYDPVLQLLSCDDLAGAVDCALRRGADRPGIYHVAPAGGLPARAGFRLAGVRRLPLACLDARRLDGLRHSATVSGKKIRRELGFAPAVSSAAALLEEFGAGARDAAAPAGQGEIPEFDPYGQDKGYIAAYGRTLFRFLHDVYWRIEHDGLENVPRQGRAVLTGVHRGFMPWDGVMALHLLARELGRHPRFLVHPTLLKFPFLANLMTKLGGLVACRENADWVLGGDELLGMFPEGLQGAFTRYRDAYRLRRFGRDEYVKMALRNGAPLVPFVTVGSAETYPILAKIDWRWFRRLTEWPCLPLGPNFPLPGLPLPSKWHTCFLAPIPVGQHPPSAADDPAVVQAISREVRARIEDALRSMLARRRSIFFGSIFAEQPATEARGVAAR